jgi:alpha-D-ribose 1-methylphosphonate 5-triphosphate synthase subunit PhnI
MYVAVKGGESAIEQSHERLAEQRRGDVKVAELGVRQIQEQLKLAVNRVMSEGSLYDPELAALAIKQSSGDLVEAIFLLRAYRTTLPKFGSTLALDSQAMQIERRISATFKDIPGGQLLGATYDYTQRLLDFSLLAEEDPSQTPVGNSNAPTTSSPPYSHVSPLEFPRVMELLNDEGLIESNSNLIPEEKTVDLTREPLTFPASRATRLQNLARADEGFLLSMAYSTQRGYSHTHPFVGEIRVGRVAVEIEIEELGFEVSIGDIQLTECEMINQFAGSKTQPAQFTRGYGLSFGHCERKAMAMSLVDRALRAEELGEKIESPAQMQEFVLSHSDSLEASGFVQHLKLPHYVDFQSELELVRKMRASSQSTHSGTDADQLDSIS